MNERYKSLHESGKGIGTIVKLLNAEGARTAKKRMEELKCLFSY